MTGICLLIAQFLSYAQNTINVSGVVTDDSDQPVIGANVIIKGTTTGVGTDLDGKYTISVPENASLEFSCLGMITRTIPVNGQKTINVVLSSDKNYLESVIVVGYGTQKRGSVTGAVSGINSSELMKTKTENPQNMLTGRVPGLRIWQTSAEPGTYSANMDIRGMGSPLVVIDGVPRTVADFQRMAPEDIENVSVLKDASAAIYGVRGANGVVLVTTKHGKAGKAKVTYDGSYTWQTPSKMPELMNAYDAMTIYNEQSMNKLEGGSLVYTDADFEAFRNGTRKETDWNKLIIAKTAPQTQHNISISGGTDKVQYYVSMGYLYQQGFFKSGDLNYDKYNVRSDITSEIARGLKFNLNISALADQRHTPYTDAVYLIRNYWKQGVLFPAYADDENTMLNYDGLDLEQNTVAMMTSDISGYRLYRQKNVTLSSSLEYDFGTVSSALSGLTAKAMFSYDYRQDDNEIYRKEYYLYAKNSVSGEYEQKLFADSSPNQLREENYKKWQKLSQFVLNYNRTFFEKHNVGAMLGWEVQKRQGDNYYAYGDLAFGSPYFTALSGDNEVTGMDAGSGSFYELGYEALIGRLNYAFDNRYLVEGQFRYDGSSRFAQGHQWGFFPSVSVGWRLSEEPFFKNSSTLNFINQLKLRASYGTLGDDSGLNYEWVNGYTYPASSGGSEKGYYNQYAPGYILNNGFVYGVSNQPLPNTNITWYTSRTFNLGIDFEAWKGLFGFSLDYFHRKRTGLFGQNSTDLPTVVGAAPSVENVNSDSHMGFELQLTHKNKIGDVSYDVTGMVTLTRQKYLTYVQNGGYANSYDKWRHDNMNDRYQGIQFGYTGAGRYSDWNDVWNYNIYKDENTLPGDYKYEDWNGDGEINGQDEHPYAYDQTPWMNYSLSFDVSYKNFDLSVLFQGSALGSMCYEEPLYSIWGSNGGGTLVQYLDRWHPVDPGADPYDPQTEWVKGYYAYTGHYPLSNSTFNRVSTAYLRLKTIELGYTLPKLRWADNYSARVYVNSYNPLTWTKVKFVDPEHPDSDLGRMYPLNKTYTFGLNISF
ncbi:MAG: TonB-dependent receptor [Bacteroidales bacterium]|jgi:TonB-linked SusC/RagA family outer membrane protein|nr:TonB-dependent receptor [Bacteroidales bacterium]MCI1786264.1 TonB-dependent receptor [Bacteroidales bacterium]